MLNFTFGENEDYSTQSLHFIFIGIGHLDILFPLLMLSTLVDIIKNNTKFTHLPKKMCWKMNALTKTLVKKTDAELK